MIPKRKSLAGKCGIPFEKDREYVEPVFARQEDTIPSEIAFQDGRRVRMGSYMHRNEFGREIFGNLCQHWVMRLDDAGTESIDLWKEGGRWFVRKDRARRD